MTFFRIAVTASLLILTAASIHGVEPEMVVPADVQVALFVNVLKLDRNFDVTRAITIAIVYQQEFRASALAKDEMAAALGRLKPPIRCVLIQARVQQELREQVTAVDADAIYVTPLRAVDVAEIAAISHQRHLRTFTGVPAYVDAGIAVGVGLRNNRPLLLINLCGAKAEGAAFTAQLLSLARIVGPLR